MKKTVPILIMLVIFILLGYPLALVFGLPLARRDMRDLRKWEKLQIVPSPILNTQGISEFTPSPGSDIPHVRKYKFLNPPAQGILVQDDVPLELDYAIDEEGVTIVYDSFPNKPEFLEAVAFGEKLEPQPRRYGFVYQMGESIKENDPTRAIYIGNQLAIEGVAYPKSKRWLRSIYTFDPMPKVLIEYGVVRLPVEQILDDFYNFHVKGNQVTIYGAFGGTIRLYASDLRGVIRDYAVLDEAEGLIVFADMPRDDVHLAEPIIQLAEQLEGEKNGTNTTFYFDHKNVITNDKNRKVFVDERLLSNESERPEERVSGEQTIFTFKSHAGIITIDDVPLSEGEDYSREANIISFRNPPERNAKVRQYSDYFLTNPIDGEITLAVAPPQDAKVWTSQYSIYFKPSCGGGLLECFFALPQHPVPFPHWIAARVVPFFQKFPITDERNIIRSTLYTALGTFSALGLGGAIGIILAVLFVLLRPLERAVLPWVIASQTVPIIALVPVMLLVLGNFGITIQTSLLPTAIIGAYICFFPVVVSTVKGLRAVDPLALDLMKSYAASPLQVFMKVRFPAAVPFFFTGLKLGTAAALVGALVAETESNNRRGLGFQILGQVQSGNVADVWILLIISGLLGIVLVAFIGLLQRLFAPWENAT